MNQKLIVVLVMLLSIYGSAIAQNKKGKAKKATTSSKGLSTAEKMGYARTNKYWGPGTFYLYAPGKPNNKMANNAITAMRDLTGLSNDDFYTEIAKQGYVEIPKKEVTKTWFNDTRNKDVPYYYSADKSYVIKAAIKDMYRSPAMENGKYAYACNALMKYVLYPKSDSAKVIEAVLQYLRDLNELKVNLSTVGTKFKKCDPKAYPIQQVGSSGWTSFRAGSFVLVMNEGKPKIHWERNENIIRRTIGNTDFVLEVLAMETDFSYLMKVKLEKEGYVVEYTVSAQNFGDLEPGNTWVKQYPIEVQQYKAGVKADKDAVDLYKKAPFPPVLEDLNKLLHIK